MRDKNGIEKFLVVILAGLFFSAIASGICMAQEASRTGRSEVFVLLQQMAGDTTTFSDNSRLEIEMDDTFVGGLGYGYNLNEYLNLNLDIFWGSSDMTGRYYSNEIKVETDMFGMDINVDYNILKRSISPITPVLTAGIGYVNFKNDDLDISETDFSYNIGAGFRWHITDRFLLKGIYRATWTELEDTESSLMLDGVSVTMAIHSEERI